jgi:hypothetical protein
MKLLCILGRWPEWLAFAVLKVRGLGWPYKMMGDTLDRRASSAIREGHQ